MSLGTLSRHQRKGTKNGVAGEEHRWMAGQYNSVAFQKNFRGWHGRGSRGTEYSTILATNSTITMENTQITLEFKVI